MKVNITRDDEEKDEIIIEDHDTWNLDRTLAQVIHPALVKLKEQSHGTPFTNYSDAPHLINTDESPLSSETEGGYGEERWDYILDEMIFAFWCYTKGDHGESLHTTGVWDKEPARHEDGSFWFKPGPDHTQVRDEEAIKKHWERIHNGLRFFGKYYGNLWD